MLTTPQIRHPGNWLPTSRPKKRSKTSKNDSKIPKLAQNQRKKRCKILLRNSGYRRFQLLVNILICRLYRRVLHTNHVFGLTQTINCLFAYAKYIICKPYTPIAEQRIFHYIMQVICKRKMHNIHIYISFCVRQKGACEKKEKPAIYAMMSFYRQIMI